MNLQDLRATLPNYAKDLRLNLESVLTEQGAPGLTPAQIALVAVASSVATRHAPLTHAIADFARAHIDESALDGARAAAAMMSMTNVYYRFTHLISDREYATLRAGLRMNVLANPGAEKVGFELASLAVSAINGCGMCIDSHEKVLKQHGVSAQAIQSAVRIGAVIHAVGVTLEQMHAANGTLAAAA